MVRWTVYVTVFILLSLNYFIESSVKRQSVVCLKELHAFAVSKTTLNASSDSTRICSTVFGCCNKSIENEMKNQVRKKLKLLIHTENERVKSKLKAIYDDLKVLCENVLHQTSEKAVNFIQKSPKQLGIIAPRAVPLIRVLFKDLQSYLSKKDMKIENSTSKFFKNFFVIVYQNLILSTQKPLPSVFEKCLMTKMHLIKPFRKVPQDITTILQQDLFPVQVFLHALKTADHLLEVSKNVELSEKCSDTLVEMSYCSLCDGFNDSKPCFGYCSHVLAQCLDPYTQIQHYWNRFMTKMGDLSNSILLSKSLYAGKLFKELQDKIAEAMSNIMLAPRKIFHYCGNATQYKGNRNYIVSLKKKQNDPPSRDLSAQANGDLYLTSDSKKPGSSFSPNAPTDSDIDKRLFIITRNLSDSTNYFGKLHSVLCTSDLAAPVNDKNKCWNGTGVGRYNTSYNLTKNVTSLRPTNSEILTKGVLQLLQKINGEIKKAEDITNKIGDVFSSGDSDGSGSGSGEEGSSPTDTYGDGEKEDTNNIPSGSGCEDDDEDCDDFSGSGRNPNRIGDKSSDDSLKTVTPTTVVVLGRNSGKRWYSCSLTLLSLLLCYLICAR